MAQRFQNWRSGELEFGSWPGPRQNRAHTKDLYACGDIALMPENQGFLACCGSSYFPGKARGSIGEARAEGW